MAGSFVVDGSDVTITFEYTTNQTKAQSIIGDSAHYLWDKGFGDHGTDKEPVFFDDLTNQQKLNVVDEYVKKSILDTSNTYKSVEAQNLARETEAESEYEI